LAFNKPRHKYSTRRPDASSRAGCRWVADLVPGKESKPLTFGGISLARHRRFALSPGSVGREACRGKGVWCLEMICSGAEEVTRARARWQDFSFGVVLERRPVVLVLGWSRSGFFEEMCMCVCCSGVWRLLLQVEVEKR
jgi:hypothetical protein